MASAVSWPAPASCCYPMVEWGIPSLGAFTGAIRRRQHPILYLALGAERFLLLSPESNLQGMIVDSCIHSHVCNYPRSCRRPGEGRTERSDDAERCALLAVISEKMVSRPAPRRASPARRW